MRSWGSLFLVALPLLPAAAQSVVIAPQAVVIDARSRTASLTLINPGNERTEVTLSTLFGYPETDSLGGLFLRTFTATPDSLPSAAAWIESFPARLTLEPGARRTIRVLVTPPAGLRDGEYWSRLVVTSRAAARPVTAAPPAGVEVALDLEVRSVIPLLYRTGAVRTGAVIDSITATPRGDTLAVRPFVRRDGNAAWVGTLRVSVRDAAGRVQRTQDAPVGVYFSLAPRIAVTTLGLAAGDYTVQVEALAQRADLPAGHVLAAPTVTRSVKVRIP